MIGSAVGRVVLTVVVAGALVGCGDLIKKLKGDDGGAGGEGEGTSSGKASVGCVIPSSITSDVTVKKGCSVLVKQSPDISKGATLTIEAGVKINVEAGVYFWIEDGKLIAKGTEKEPIVMTSANKTQAAGDWVGLVFENKTQAGSELDFVHIDYAGGSTSNGHGAIEIKNQGSAKRISLVNVSITNSAQSAIVDNSEKGGFARFEKNVFKKNKNSLEAHSHVLGSVGAGNVFSDPLIVEGNVTENTVWPAFDAPVLVKNSIDVGGDKSPAALTIAPKTTLKFNPGQYLAIGTDNGGSLTANGVLFTSQNASPQAGDWVGLFVYPKVSVLQLDGAIIEYAGANAANGRAALTFYNGPAKAIRAARITNVTFRHNAVAAMASPDNDCSPFLAGNRSDVPLCRAQ